MKAAILVAVVCLAVTASVAGPPRREPPGPPDTIHLPGIFNDPRHPDPPLIHRRGLWDYVIDNVYTPVKEFVVGPEEHKGSFTDTHSRPTQEYFER